MNSIRKSLIFTLVINIIVPYISYIVLVPYTSHINALIISSIAPLLETLYSLIRMHKVDVFSAVIFFSLVLSIIAVLIGGNERFILLRESYITGIMGSVFLVSLLFSKPLIFYFARRFSNNPQLDYKWEQSASMRRTFRVLTRVWGLTFLFEAMIKIVLVYSLSVETFLLVSTFITYSLIGLIILWTIHYVKARRAL
ncbi:VC0807 family protein [Bacillus sp. FSL K6-0268]|uniref:VC0807 family protein n=1 Tax=Bacillus sp. FSL K6-0268 TaxID=2921449 RepID=UPI0030FB27DE